MPFEHLKAHQIDRGYWGAHTSTIDWCELNYTHTPYIAEFINTLTNLPVIFLSLYGFYKTYYGGAPVRYALCYLGLALVGIGSTGFHASLRWEWQLLDELPMIYVVSWSTYLTFDTLPTSEFRGGRFAPYLVVLWDIIVTISYFKAPNPVYHQLAFALILLSGLFRNLYLLLNLPPDSPSKQKVISTIVRGIAIFATGFAIWNIDNMFCGFLRRGRKALGGVLGVVLEGHGYWHLLTGYGAFLIFTASIYLCLSIKTTPDSYTYDSNSYFPIVEAASPQAKQGLKEAIESSEASSQDENGNGVVRLEGNVGEKGGKS